MVVVENRALTTVVIAETKNSPAPATVSTTGHQSTRVIFGAAALGRASTLDETQATLDLLLEHGVNHIDTAAAYGRSERRVGEWMRDHRDRFFLATKTGERTYEKARDQFRHSLERMQVASVDLDFRSVRLTSLRVEAATGRVLLGFPAGEALVEVVGDVEVSVPAEAAVTVVGTTRVPAGWSIGADGASAPVGGAGWRIVAEAGSVRIVSR